MAVLVQLPINEIQEAVAETLPHFPQVAGALLFGSALGSCRPDSDIDLGLIIFPPCTEPPGWGFARLEADVERKLQPAVYIRDEDAVFDFVEKAGRVSFLLNRRRSFRRCSASETGWYTATQGWH